MGVEGKSSLGRRHETSLKLELERLRMGGWNASDVDFQFQSLLGVEIAKDYIAEEDGFYGYQLLSKWQTAAGQATVYALNMTSQKWLDSKRVNHPVWWHALFVIVPTSVTRRGVALLNIDDGENYISPASPASPYNFQPRPIAIEAALLSGTVVGDLHQIPNEPLEFNGDGQEQSEDALLAYGYHQFMRTLDPLWVPLLPMAKAAVKAMDTVQAVMQEQQGWAPESFFVAGWSKRGWTTYLTAAVDSRVAACAPCVMEIPNAEMALLHIYRVYGFWPPAIQPYVVNNVTNNIYTPQFQLLRLFVDPVVYRQQLGAVPKFIASASGDQFFPPDTAWLGEQWLDGERHHYFASNENHLLTHADAPDNAARQYSLWVSQTDRPSYNWTVDATNATNAVITFVALPPHAPQMVKLWQNTNATARDFRLNMCSIYSNGYILPSAAPNVYSASLHAPPQGWTSFYLEATYVYPVIGFFKITTIPYILPSTLPFPNPIEIPDVPPLF